MHRFIVGQWWGMNKRSITSAQCWPNWMRWGDTGGSNEWSRGLSGTLHSSLHCYIMNLAALPFWFNVPCRVPISSPMSAHGRRAELFLSFKHACLFIWQHNQNQHSRPAVFNPLLELKFLSVACCRIYSVIELAGLWTVTFRWTCHGYPIHLLVFH